MSEWDLVNGKRPKGDDDGRAPFGRKATLWFRAAVGESLSVTDDEHPQPAAEGDELEQLTDWLCEEPLRYVKWQPASEYHGKRFSTGAWVLDLESIAEDLPLGRKVIRRKAARIVDGDTIKTLDDWLRADAQGTLKDPGAIGGSEYLTDEWKKWARQNAAITRAKWSRKCTSCGESFKRKYRGRVRCDACCAKRRRRMGVLP